MGLKEKLKKQDEASAAQKGKGLQRHGFVSNPFPAASQTQGHPHMETDADDKITTCVEDYDRNLKSQVLVIEGEQGTGKTNLLKYYEEEFRDVYGEQGFHVIRYFADPEPGFDKMLARIISELGKDFKLIEKITLKLNEIDDEIREQVINNVKSGDMKTVLRSLSKAAQNQSELSKDIVEITLEWLLGFRLLKRHREKLGQIYFRLDTIESKTQALRDIIYCGAELGALKGLILLMDELEKQDDTTSKINILRFLGSIRALIDALPKYLFLMLAITPVARQRYFAMLPAFAGRLQNRIELPTLQDSNDALKLFHFYLEKARDEAIKEFGNPGSDYPPILSDDEVKTIFNELLKKANDRGDSGVRQRDFLNTLHNEVKERL